MKALVTIALIIAGIYAVGVALLALNQRALVYHPNPEAVAPTLPGVNAVRIETEDGERIVAWWSPPQNETAPVFLYFDGNGGSPEAWDVRWRAIIEGGAGFLAVYYRGYSGSTGRPHEQGLYADARAGYDWLIAQGYGPRDIVIHGMSLGSGVATRLASERPARALILEAPFTSVVDVASEIMPIVPSFVVSERFMSRERIGRVRMPVLIAHGEDDDVISIRHGERLFALANAPKAFVRMPGGRHTSLPDDGLYEHIWAFLAQHPGE